MAKKFLERHKRKSVLAALLLLFKGRAKIFIPLLLVVGAGITFVFHGNNFAKIIELPPVASFLEGIGLGEWAASFNPYYEPGKLGEEFKRLTAGDENRSFWEKFFRRVTYNKPIDGSLSMITGADILKENIRYKNEGEGPVERAVSEEEKERGEYDDAVNLEDMIAGKLEEGLYGDLMGEHLADRQGSGAFGGYAPRLNRKMMSSPGGAAGEEEGMYMAAMDNAGGKVPIAGKPSRAKGKNMGKVSGFSWKNVGYGKKKANMNARINSQKRAMFQLAETFAMTGSAYTNSDAAYEYQASYTGSTYDGNDVNAEVIQTDAQAPAVPDTAFTGDLVTGGGEWQEIAKECGEAQANQGARMSEIADQIDTISKNMGSPPKCCDRGGVRRWNGKVNQMKTLCQEFNANAEILSQKCQGADQKMDCNGTYDPLKIKPCSKWKCWLGVILAIIMIVVGILLAVFTAGLAAAIGVALIVAGAAMLIGQIIGGPMGQMISLVGMIIGGFIAGGPLGMLAAGVANSIFQQAAPEDGSNALNND